MSSDVNSLTAQAEDHKNHNFDHYKRAQNREEKQLGAFFTCKIFHYVFSLIILNPKCNCNLQLILFRWSKKFYNGERFRSR